MSDMIEVQVSDLIGPALDWAVAKAVSRDVSVLTGGVVVRGEKVEGGCPWRPSASWSQCGPLIESQHVDISAPSFADDNDKRWDARVDNGGAHCWESGRTPLIAACRAIVAAHSGDRVSAPTELLAK